MNRGHLVTALLIEDSEPDRIQFMRHIRHPIHRYQVDAVPNLEQAIERLQHNRYDVILTDLCLQDSSGLETVAAIKQHSKDQPIIVLTGMPADENLELSIFKAGAQDYILKGELNSALLIRSIRQSIQRQEIDLQAGLLAKLRKKENQLKEQAEMLKSQNTRLKKLYLTAQELVDNVSHDFRTPLSVIRDYVNIIKEGLVGEVNERQCGMLHTVSIRTDDLNNMVDGLLDISKMQSGLLGTWRRPVEVELILERVESMLQQRADVKEVGFTIVRDENLPTVFCDPDKAARVLTNLGVNAIKFTPRGGDVVLEVDYQREDSEVVFRVIDNGPGIEKDNMLEIFQRFRQLDRQLKKPIHGFGLGLNISQQLCRLNLGELSVASEIGKGSTFWFAIPCSEPVEVLRRWLKIRGKGNRSFLAMECTIERQSIHLSDAFENFLSCMLDGDDLLLRVDDVHWNIFRRSDPGKGKASDWINNLRQQFQQSNRSHPHELLPEFSARLWNSWPANVDHEHLVSAFASQGTSACL